MFLAGKKVIKSLLLIIILSWAVEFNVPNALAENSLSCPKEMVYIPGGNFRMGSERNDFLEERAVDDVTVDSFCIDSHEVTNEEFSRFVEETGYLTVAERPLSKEQFPDLSEAERKPGSLVFQPPEKGLKEVPYLSWWHWVQGANWQHPYGADSNIEGLKNHPVVHIAYEDAVAYARWAGKQLPTPQVSDCSGG